MNKKSRHRETFLLGIAALSLLPVHCAQSSTAELLSARALGKGQSPPQLIAPADGEHVPLTVLLRFSGQSVNVALLEIATDDNFTNLVVRQRVAAGAQTYLFNAPQSRTYYWRFYGGVESAVYRFHAGDAIYVNAMAAAPGSGTQFAPFTSLQTALDRARVAKLPVFVAGGSYSETLAFPAGIKAYGGYNPVNWIREPQLQKTRLVAQSATGHTASGIYIDSVISGFVFTSAVNSGTVRLLNLSASQDVLRIEASEFFPAEGSTAQTHTSILCSFSCRAVISGNTFYSPLNGAVYTGINSQQNSAPAITNNVFVLRPATVAILSDGHAGVRIVQSVNTMVTNNLFLATAKLTNGMLPGGAESMSGIYLDESGGGGVITNNVAYALKGVRHFSFLHTGNNDLIFPASLENNAYYFYEAAAACNSLFTFRPSPSMGVCRIYHEPVYSLTALHAYTLYLGGSDKARGNYLLPSGSAGQFIRRLPESATTTQQDGPDAAQLVLHVVDNNSTPCNSIFATGDYLEWNRDNIPRQITGCSIYVVTPFVEYHYRYAISPPLASTTENKAGREVLLWGSDNGSSGYVWDFSFEQKSLTTGDWNTLRYGGKDASGNNCGAPAGGPGTGPGGQSCGNATRDRAGVPRTTGSGALAGNTGGSGAVCDGFSIGPWELE